jgi:hydrogenase nickel incorporation protein HypA/HybF
MHELSVCNALLEQVERVARSHRAEAVSRIVLRIGPLSGIEPQLLHRAWPLAAEGTLAGAAELVVEPADVVVHCLQCKVESVVPANALLCRICGDFRTRLVSGDEMILQRVELDRSEGMPAPPQSAAASGTKSGASFPDRNSRA